MPVPTSAPGRGACPGRYALAWSGTNDEARVVEALSRYRLVEPVARGGMGEVWRALAPDGSQVAVKRLLAGPGASEPQRRRFQREVQALLRLRHPNVVRLLDAGQVEGAPFLVMEWIDGETLERRLERDGPFDPRAAGELVRRLALGLEHCHAQGVLHRDLKPANVLLRARDGEPLLTDFGLVREIDASGSGTQVTVAGRLLGTPGWWPPEQTRGEPGEAGPPADVWGLGALLFALLTGQPPCRGETLVEVLAALARGIPPPGALRPGLPRELDALCARCLALSPEARPRSAAAVAAELERWLGRARTQPRGRGATMAPAAGVVVLAAVAVLSLAIPRPAPTSVAPAPVPSASPPPPPIPERRADARALVAEATARSMAHDDAGALALARQALEADPACGAAWAALVRSRIALEGFRDAPGLLRDATRALELEPDTPSTLTDCAQIRLALEDPKGAAADASRAIALAPGYGVAWAVRSDARRLMNDLDGAAADADGAIACDPADSGGWDSRTRIDLARRDWSAADADATHLLELAPRSPEAYFLRARARCALGDPPRAIEDATRAIALDPRAAGAWSVRADAHRILGDWLEARSDASKAIELAPEGASAFRVRSVARRHLDDLPGAQTDAERATQLAPDDPQTWTTLADARRFAGDFPGALEAANRAVAAGPDSPYALFTRGILLVGQRDNAGAVADFERCIELDPKGEVGDAAAQALADLRGGRRPR